MSLKKLGQDAPVDLPHRQKILRIDIVLNRKSWATAEFHFMIEKPVELFGVKLHLQRQGFILDLVTGVYLFIVTIIAEVTVRRSWILAFIDIVHRDESHAIWFDS